MKPELTDEEKIEQGQQAQQLLDNGLLAAILDKTEKDAITATIQTEDDTERRVYAYQARFARAFRNKLEAKVRTGKQAAERRAQ